MTRVLVVDDSRFMRTVVGDALERAGYEVETAADGERAVEAVSSFDPDVVTMDVEMPGMDGIRAVERIMSTEPTSILMLSAHTTEGATATLDALERGAVDFLHKPDGSETGTVAHLTESIVEAVESIENANVSTLALARATAAAHRTRSRSGKRAIPAGSNGGDDTDPVGGRSTPDEPIEVDPATVEEPTIVIGASTGGPRIIEDVVSRLPRGLNATVLIVQHMPSAFTGRFAARLDAVSEYEVREARDGDRVAGGEILVAAGGHHLVVTSVDDETVQVHLTDDDPINGVRPSIDVTMETVADCVTGPLAGVVLTGMGRDGAVGIEAIADAGGVTIAQDERTSPVFGIPRQAIETGCVDAVVPADGLVDRLVDAFTTDGDSNG